MNASRRSRHLLQRPQWSPPSGCMHDSVSSSGTPRLAPSRTTSGLCIDANGVSMAIGRSSPSDSARCSAPKNSGVASGNGLLESVASAIRWTEWRHAVAILGACVFAVFGIERLGYRLTLVFVLSFLLKIVERRGWLLTASVAFVLSFGSFFLFYKLLRVPLPQGPFGF